MIEVEMVRRMARRALLLGPVLVAGVWVWGGIEYAVSAGIGVVLTLGNLWLSAGIIGAVAERNPQLLLPAGLATFALGLLILTAAALALRAIDVVNFPVTGFVLVGSHLVLVLWEATSAYDKVGTPGAAAGTR